MMNVVIVITVNINQCGIQLLKKAIKRLMLYAKELIERVKVI